NRQQWEAHRLWRGVAHQREAAGFGAPTVAIAVNLVRAFSSCTCPYWFKLLACAFAPRSVTMGWGERNSRKKPASNKSMTTSYTAIALAFLLVASLASAQTVEPALRPPKGAQVALVVFEDLQCPDCRRAAPLVAEAGRTYKIPVVRHDFPLPMHNWSFDAAIIARYFDTVSK